MTLEIGRKKEDTKIVSQKYVLLCAKFFGKLGMKTAASKGATTQTNLILTQSDIDPFNRRTTTFASEAAVSAAFYTVVAASDHEIQKLFYYLIKVIWNCACKKMLRKKPRRTEYRRAKNLPYTNVAHKTTRRAEEQLRCSLLSDKYV